MPRPDAKSANPQIVAEAVRLFDAPYNHKVTEIATRLGMTPGQVSGLIHRARKRGEIKRPLAQCAITRQSRAPRQKRRPAV